MIEVLWHGRGGQGAFTAARLLGAASALSDGRFALAFPSFGPERRGAPMRAFTKMDVKPIGDRSAIELADFVIYLDGTLFDESGFSELKPGGRILVNSVERFDDPRVIAIDANGISQEILGRAIPNTVFLGAMAALCDALSVEDACEAIRQYMAPKLHAGNIRIVEQVAAMMESAAATPGASAARPDGSGADVSTADVPGSACDPDGRSLCAQARKAIRIPQLHGEGSLPDHSVFARTTCFTAGHLVAKNAGWRNIRPVISANDCTGCMKCYMDCPDGTIFKTAGLEQRSEAAVAVDYDFCKGCGICARSCTFGAISMIPESEAHTR